MVKKSYSSALAVALLCTSCFSPRPSSTPLLPCQALIPQTQSFSEWDDQLVGLPSGPAPSSDTHSKEDEEFVQLDAQAASAVSSEARAMVQARIQAQEAFKAKIEARLNAVEATKSSIREL